MKPIAAVNDFVVKFANVNGSGSASANELFAKAILRMGVPVSPRNIFPSNIQGLPTWYEVRVNEQGWLGRRGGVDLMVAMNPQTWDADVKEIEPGGYLLHDSTRPLPKSKFRDDIHVIGIPLTEMCNRAWTDALHDALGKNDAGVYSNFLEVEGEERIRAAYPDGTYDRLSEVKRRYDPSNLFRMNQNIRPAAMG
jgi:2-oxoglutarate ferredoxin oxidoreductase subunit alpha